MAHSVSSTGKIVGKSGHYQALRRDRGRQRRWLTDKRFCQYFAPQPRSRSAASISIAGSEVCGSYGVLPHDRYFGLLNARRGTRFAELRAVRRQTHMDPEN